MADFGTNQNNQTGASPRTKTQPVNVRAPKESKKKTSEGLSNVALTFLIEQAKRASFQQVVVIGVVITQLVIIWQLILPSVQNTQNAYVEYRNEIKKINDKEIIDMKNKIEILEAKVASLSAQ